MSLYVKDRAGEAKANTSFSLSVAKPVCVGPQTRETYGTMICVPSDRDTAPSEFGQTVR